MSLRTWDGAGNITLDSNDVYDTLCAEIAIGAGNQSGSATIAALAEGEGFVLPVGGDHLVDPIISISGTTVSWAKNTAYAHNWIGTLYVWVRGSGGGTGITVWSASGPRQIGGVRPYAQLLGKGQILTVPNDGRIQLATSVANMPAGRHVAIRPHAPMAIMFDFLAGDAPVGTPIDYWVFGPGAIPAGAALRTFDPSGAHLFADTMRPMRRVATFDAPAGRTYAGVQARLGNRIHYVPASEDITLSRLAGTARAIGANGGGLALSDYRHSEETETTATPDPSRETTVEPAWITLDVTDY